MMPGERNMEESQIGAMKHLSTIPKKVSLLPMKQGIAETLIMTQDYESPSSPSTMKQSMNSKQKETAFVDIRPEKYTTPPILPDWCFSNLGSFYNPAAFSMPFGAGIEQTYLGASLNPSQQVPGNWNPDMGPVCPLLPQEGSIPNAYSFADSYQHPSPFQQAEAVYPNPDMSPVYNFLPQQGSMPNAYLFPDSHQQSWPFQQANSVPWFTSPDSSFGMNSTTSNIPSIITSTPIASQSTTPISHNEYDSTMDIPKPQWDAQITAEVPDASSERNKQHWSTDETKGGLVAAARHFNAKEANEATENLIQALRQQGILNCDFQKKSDDLRAKPLQYSRARAGSESNLKKLQEQEDAVDKFRDLEERLVQAAIDRDLAEGDLKTELQMSVDKASDLEEKLHKTLGDQETLRQEQQKSSGKIDELQAKVLQTARDQLWEKQALKREQDDSLTKISDLKTMLGQAVAEKYSLEGQLETEQEKNNTLANDVDNWLLQSDRVREAYSDLQKEYKKTLEKFDDLEEKLRHAALDQLNFVGLAKEHNKALETVDELQAKLLLATQEKNALEDKMEKEEQFGSKDTEEFEVELLNDLEPEAVLDYKLSSNGHAALLSEGPATTQDTFNHCVDNFFAEPIQTTNEPQPGDCIYCADDNCDGDSHASVREHSLHSTDTTDSMDIQGSSVSEESFTSEATLQDTTCSNVEDSEDSSAFACTPEVENNNCGDQPQSAVVTPSENEPGPTVLWGILSQEPIIPYNNAESQFTGSDAQFPEFPEPSAYTKSSAPVTVEGFPFLFVLLAVFIASLSWFVGSRIDGFDLAISLALFTYFTSVLHETEGQGTVAAPTNIPAFTDTPPVNIANLQVVSIQSRLLLPHHRWCLREE